MTKRFCNKHTGLLLIRLAAGSIFLVHGISKLSNMDGTIGFFQSLGFGPFFAWLVALTETIGGAALILGFGTAIVGVMLAIVMLVAIIKVKWSMGGFGKSELEVALLAMSLGIVAAGPGRYSLGRYLCGCCKGGTCRTDGKCTCHWFCGGEGCHGGKNCNDEGSTCATCTDKDCGCSTCKVK